MPHFLHIFEQHHSLSANLGMLSPSLQDFIFPPIHTLQVPPLLTKYFQKQRTQCLGELSLLILSSTYHAFTLWQRSALPHFLDNPQNFPPSICLRPGQLTKPSWS